MTPAGPSPFVLELLPGDGVGEEAANAAPVVGFNLGGALPPLICVRAWRREVQNYRSLAVALGPDQPIFAASPPRGDVEGDFPRDTAAWARFFMDSLGSLLQRDSISLGGWSYSGVIALEIAELLAAEGRPPRLVNLFDSIMPVAKPRGDARKRSELHKLVVAIGRGLEIQDPKVRNAFYRDYARRKSLRATKRLVRRVRSTTRRLVGRDPLPPKALSARKGAKLGEIEPLSKAIRVGYLKSRPKPSTLPVALYWTEQSQEKFGDASLGWSIRMFGDFRCHPVAGDHETLFAPENVGRLASTLEEELRLARRMERDPIAPHGRQRLS